MAPKILVEVRSSAPSREEWAPKLVFRWESLAYEQHSRPFCRVKIMGIFVRSTWGMGDEKIFRGGVGKTIRELREWVGEKVVYIKYNACTYTLCPVPHSHQSILIRSQINWNVNIDSSRARLLALLYMGDLNLCAGEKNKSVRQRRARSVYMHCIEKREHTAQYGGVEREDSVIELVVWAET